MREAWLELAATARRMTADGLVVGTSGNVSARFGDDRVLVTPSGVPYEELDQVDPVAVNLEGHQVNGKLKPTSELPLHLSIYASTPARAVVHTHAVHATAVSTLVDELPPIHYMTAALGGVVRVAPYALYGTEELAQGMRAALKDRSGCLLRNHGTIVYGDTLAAAYDRTAQLEWMCQVWLTARSAGAGEPSLLSEAQLAEVGEKLKGYGQR
ncbi:class II aldolase/adducin family protein [Streptomyces sp. A7024]|uniref:Class II aldolase/adducin family protein n=1 Tax=Streptomyces coryli TaxID=1128680 RepID=A0A6G4U5C8_9ACTN|nr:class II aldolase/adducin family protein [Streptomyces coryli]